MSKFIAAALIISAIAPQALPFAVVKVVEVTEKIQATSSSISAALVSQE